MNIIALIISVLAFLLSLTQFVRNTTREKKEATLNSYKTLQNSVFSKINRLLKTINIDEVDVNDDHWEELTDCLVSIEQFSVGINTGIYSLHILNELGGGYFIRIYYELKPIIDKKEKANISKGKHYNHYQCVVKKLEKLRNNNTE